MFLQVFALSLHCSEGSQFVMLAFVCMLLSFFARVCFQENCIVVRVQECVFLDSATFDFDCL